MAKKYIVRLKDEEREQLRAMLGSGNAKVRTITHARILLMDVFTRAIRGWNLSRSLDTDLTLVALQQALSLCIPEIHHSDQGVQYAAQEYVVLLQQYPIQISMAAQGKPEENGYAERLMRTIKGRGGGSF